MKKTKIFVALLIALVMMMTVALTACKHNHEFVEWWTSDENDHWHIASCQHTSEVADKAAHEYGTDGVCLVCERNQSDVGIVYGVSLMDLEDFQAYLVADLLSTKNLIGTIDSGEVDAAVLAAYNAGVAAVNAATSVGGAQQAAENAKMEMVECVPLASGLYSFAGKSIEEKTQILGLLEAYAYRTGISGIPLYENGNYQMYSTRVQLGTETYIPGYGFGTLAHGSLTSALASESNDAWKMYYHTLISKDDGTANYLNSTGSSVGDIYGYFAGSYYTIFMNQAKNGYDWTGELAVSNPVPLTSWGGELVEEYNGTGTYSTWRIELRNDLKYTTMSSISSRSAYNNQAIAIEDYLTGYKLLLNQGNAYTRGSDLANASGASSIVGAKAYYAATKDAAKGVDVDPSVADFNNVHVKAYVGDGNNGTEVGKFYLEYELTGKVTMFYSRYYINGSLYAPVPASFVTLVGVDNYLGFESNDTTIVSTPVDNSLSSGAYVLERWDSDQQIVFKKNENYAVKQYNGQNVYNIAGVHINVLEAALTNNQAAFEEFLAGKIDAAGIPLQRLDEFKTDPRARKTTGDTVFKLNVNALDAETWEYFFGTDGIIEQNATSNYWNVKPALSNEHFRRALSYATDRDGYASVRGAIASLDFFSTDYLSDPEGGISYDNTQAHKDALESLSVSGNDYGYSLELAREYFRVALSELEASGAYTRGSKKNPTVISIEIAWQAASQETSAHNFIKQYWEGAFNDESVTGGFYKLEINFWSPPDGDYTKTYDKMQTGQFDIGMGSIGGNTLDPLNFMSTLSADPDISQGWTLNWGTDTNDPYANVLIYEGMLWSYDALYQASQGVVVVSDGIVDGSAFELDADYEAVEGGVEVTLVFTYLEQVVITDEDLKDMELVIYGYVSAGGDNFAYTEDDLTYLLVFEGVGQNVEHDKATRTVTITITVPESAYEGFLDNSHSSGNPFLYYQGIDLYIAYSVPSIGEAYEKDYVDGWWVPFVAL